jgi:hypothetical protein
MTLPAYRPSADHSEQVLGREGERDGIDVIVDLPTEEEIERQRDEEMEAMYQIRAARRQQNAERDEIARERQRARERRDPAALNNIRDRQRQATTSNQSQLDELRADVERIKETRQRSVSSVSYADLGVARHDGTRLRASSNDSERMGLLSDAASINLSTRSGAPSPAFHRRDRSVGSVASYDSDFPLRASGERRRSSVENRAGSSPELIEADLGAGAMPPPEYEDVSLNDDLEAPAPVRTRSTTPVDSPPDYSGPFRLEPDRVGRPSHREAGPNQGMTLRTHLVPEIVVQPSSAHPDNETPR